MRLLIAGGGTGGHVYPGIAVAEEVAARPGGDVLFVGTARGLEASRVPAAGFKLELVDVTGLNRVGASALVRGLGRLPRAFWQATTLLRRFRPDAVLGVGGYVSGPVVLAASLLGVPTAILEQNSFPGFTNRVLGRLVRRVYIAFDKAREFFAGSKVAAVGNPVRRQFVEATARFAAGPLAAPGAGTPGPAAQQVLVLGGSQGARAVNDLVVAAVDRWRMAGPVPRLVHQTGAKDEARVRALYAAMDLPAGAVAVSPFIEEMAAALGAATLVVARAGALTLAELAIVGRPAALIPLPTAADDHQAWNAAAFAEAGAAQVLEQARTDGAGLLRQVEELLGDPPRLARMSAAMRSLGRPHAARDLVDDLAARVAGRATRDAG